LLPSIRAARFYQTPLRLISLAAIVLRLPGFGAVDALKPPAKIDIGAAAGAEWLMPRNGMLAADRASARGGRHRRDGIGIAGISHAADIGSQGHDVKRVRADTEAIRFAIRHRHNRDPASEAEFESSERRCRRTAQRRLDGRNDH
jgi:hypothetical protein